MDVIQFISFFGVFPNCGVSVFFDSKESPLHLVAACKLLFLYGMECKVCIATIHIHNDYIC